LFSEFLDPTNEFWLRWTWSRPRSTWTWFCSDMEPDLSFLNYFWTRYIRILRQLLVKWTINIFPLMYFVLCQ
jgi:hypothetical protein